MSEENPTLVVGEGKAADAAVRLLARHGKKVERTYSPKRHWDQVVVSRGLVPPEVEEFAAKGAIISELELGFQHSFCLNVAVAGENGKSTTCTLVEAVLQANHLKTRVAGTDAVPFTSVVEETRDLDFLVLNVSFDQLRRTKFFRPSVAVLLNLSPEVGCNGYSTALAHLFKNQQPFDWVIAQSEALASMHSLNIPVSGKVISFSAHSKSSDLYLSRGMIMSRLEGWQGPLLDMSKCKIQGVNHTENMMAAMAVGRVLRVPLEVMVECLENLEPLPHRFERIGEADGVVFINDARSRNGAALRSALESVPEGGGGQPNIWLISGGSDSGADYHELGPMLSNRVKGAILLGGARERIRSAWGLFTSCQFADTIEAAVGAAVAQASAGDYIMLSPASRMPGPYEGFGKLGEAFKQAVSATCKNLK